MEGTTQETKVTEPVKGSTPTIADEAAAAVKARGEGNLTMYSLVQALNVVMDAHGLAKVREQQLYNYRTKGVIKNLVDGKATPKGAVEFITKFVTKRVETPAS